MRRRYYSTYARWVGIRHIRKMHSASSEDRRIEAAKEAIAWLERARRGRRERKNKRRERWTELDEFGDLLIRAQIAPVALVAGDLDKAWRYANDVLRTRDVAIFWGCSCTRRLGGRSVIRGTYRPGQDRSFSRRRRSCIRASPPGISVRLKIIPNAQLAGARYRTRSGLAKAR